MPVLPEDSVFNIEFDFGVLKRLYIPETDSKVALNIILPIV